MANRTYSGLIFIGVLFLAATAFAAFSLMLPMTDPIGNVGPAFFPLVTASLAALLLLITLIIDSRNIAAEASDTRGLQRTALVFSSLVLYLLSLERIGFVISTIGFIIVLSQIIRLLSFGVSKRHSNRKIWIRDTFKSVAIAGVIATVSATTIYTTFTNGFGLILP